MKLITRAMSNTHDRFTQAPSGRPRPIGRIHRFMPTYARDYFRSMAARG
jgi:hypothetical protein